ncbi:alpha/beta fold hydrolase [Mucilaginibacter kameinonensis]|uniref:alpha/beta fold hydrolase n=1 Tax=Mucilaginibacter kameinonensis TaxID=452286 RepID=UPI0013CE648B|nr:alpha/beta hydrolase [Mucilaginibacter kameinonensis]
MFLHFWGGSSATWAGVISLLKDKYRCISYDSRGWGKSDKPDNGYHIASLANDALRLIEVLNLDSYILIGHSMGGKVAQYIAAQKPDGLRKLILVAPSPSFSTMLPPDIAEGMRTAYTSLGRINETIDHVFKVTHIDTGQRKDLVEGLQNHNTYSRLGWTDVALLEDVSDGVDEISVPTLIIAGENDIVDPPERLEQEVKSFIPGSEMVTIADVGHLSMLEKPSVLADLISAFIRRR